MEEDEEEGESDGDGGPGSREPDDDDDDDEHDVAWLLEQNTWLMQELEAKDGEEPEYCCPSLRSAFCLVELSGVSFGCHRGGGGGCRSLVPV